MTREEKELVIKDLSARLPYGVKLKIRQWTTPVEVTIIKHSVLSGNYIINENYRLDDIKPYLRPISSMTEEEKKELNNVLYYADDSCMCEASDWLNARHFDYRKLIEKGLAISTNVFNPYKD